MAENLSHASHPAGTEFTRIPFTILRGVLWQIRKLAGSRAQ
jgi:hypothetical protein